MLHVPLLRRGRPYRSLETRRLPHVVTGEAVAEISQANPGLVARDLDRAAEARRALAVLPARRLLEIAGRAADLFTGADLPLGDPADGATQSPDDYVAQLSATTGMPHALARANMAKIRFVLAEMETVLAGLSRGLDPSVLDDGRGEEGGRAVSFQCETDVLGVVLPSNSPGVHALWIPAIGLKVPVALKPGGLEPWTPWRVLQALLAAGCPLEAAGFYPCGHAGAEEILLRSGRSMLFGDRSTVGAWADDPRVQLHGPGWSKVILDREAAEAGAEHLELIAESVAANGGRSCINASGLWIAATRPGRGRALAEALAERLARIAARPLDHPEAALAAFPDRAVARRISDWVDARLAERGAEDLSAAVRGDRLVEAGGCTYLLPTVVWCDDPGHPLAETELLFPFVSVVELPREELLGRLGPTLVASVVTEDREWAREALACRAIERLNLGAVPTSRVDWDQPHEGNLFAHLYRQRAVQGVV